MFACSVFQALSVGIFPYVLKLLQSSARELRPLLVFIWAKILAVDSVRKITLAHFKVQFIHYYYIYFHRLKKVHLLELTFSLFPAIIYLI